MDIIDVGGAVAAGGLWEATPAADLAVDEAELVAEPTTAAKDRRASGGGGGRGGCAICAAPSTAPPSGTVVVVISGLSVPTFVDEATVPLTTALPLPEPDAAVGCPEILVVAAAAAARSASLYARPASLPPRCPTFFSSSAGTPGRSHSVPVSTHARVARLYSTPRRVLWKY